MRKGKYVAPSFVVPADLPARGVGFRSLRWDLSPLRADLQGSYFEMEAQVFAAPSDATKGAYRFRKPRFLTSQGAYEVGNIRVLVNGKLRYTNLMAHVVTLYRSTDAQQIMLQATAP